MYTKPGLSNGWPPALIGLFHLASGSGNSNVRRNVKWSNRVWGCFLDKSRLPHIFRNGTPAEPGMYVCMPWPNSLESRGADLHIGLEEGDVTWDGRCGVDSLTWMKLLQVAHLIEDIPISSYVEFHPQSQTPRSPKEGTCMHTIISKKTY
jgi:hypothetical protein